MTRHVWAPLICAAAITLNACAQPQPSTPVKTERDLEVETKLMTVEFDATPPAQDRMDRAVSAFLDAGTGKILVVGAADEAERLADRVAMAGVPRDRIDIRETDETGPWLSFRVHKTVLPDCTPEPHRPLKTDAGDRLHTADPNTPPEAFGCPTRRNLGAMVADPADLEGPDAPGHAADDVTTRALRNNGN